MGSGEGAGKRTSFKCAGAHESIGKRSSFKIPQSHATDNGLRDTRHGAQESEISGFVTKLIIGNVAVVHETRTTAARTWKKIGCFYTLTMLFSGVFGAFMIYAGKMSSGDLLFVRSEERRVGKEGCSWWQQNH